MPGGSEEKRRRSPPTALETEEGTELVQEEVRGVAEGVGVEDLEDDVEGCWRSWDI